MAFEHYIRSGTKLLRCGYTTGTCAALAAAGAATMLLTDETPETMQLCTPKGITVEVALEDCGRGEAFARCAVRKDGGDDPDVTDGLLIYAEASKTDRGISIDGGAGVGRVTKAGLNQPVGAAAINTVPRQMIAAAVENVCAETGYSGGLAVTISVPGGAEVAAGTFNPILGIEGGISILGTSGIVEPMSEQAIVDTIAVELHQAALENRAGLLLTPGNYGMQFIGEMSPELPPLPCVKYSNYLGDALDIAALEGFGRVLVVGHIGKLVKLAGGIMNMHSKAADCRRELFCAHAALCGAGQEVCQKLMEQVTTDGCIAILDEKGLRQPVMEGLIAAMQHHLERRAGGAMRVGVVVFSNEYGLLGQSEAGAALLREWSEQLKKACFTASVSAPAIRSI